MATKKTSSRTKSKSAAATERERKKRELHSRQQFWAIVVFAVAVFIMATTLVEGQNVWNWIHNFFLGMFGWSAYLIAPLLFYVSIMTALDGTMDIKSTLGRGTVVTLGLPLYHKA